MSAPVIGALRVLNFLLADEGVILLAVPIFLWAYGSIGLVVAIALLVTSTKVEEKLKGLFRRGRPRGERQGGDPHEWGIPSGDCALVGAWAPIVFSWWAAVPIALVMWARMARDAHWPLDTVAGVALGLWLVLPALVLR